LNIERIRSQSALFFFEKKQPSFKKINKTVGLALIFCFTKNKKQTLKKCFWMVEKPWFYLEDL
jgi:hypothetical protein